MLLRIEKFSFYLFIFLIPFQIRIFLINSGNEWNSIFLYLTDLLIILILLLGIVNTKLKGLRFKKSDLFLISFFLVAIFSLFSSTDLGNSAYRLIKLLQFLLLYIYIMYRRDFLKTENIFKVLVFSGVFQSILAIAQFYKQSSLGIKFIEAGIFKPGAAGVATFIMENGEKVLRAYGSFSHPNVLAGFILMAIFTIYATLITNHTRMTRIFLMVSFFFLSFGLFLTFSRAGILVFVVGSLVMFLFYLFRIRNLRGFNLLQEVKPLKIKIFQLLGLFIVSCILIVAILFPYLKSRFFEISFEEQAIDLRFFYNKMAIQMIKEKPILGIGIGNFVNYSENYSTYLRAAGKMLGLSKIPDWIYQPVHNIYLLIASEIGILGLLAFLGFIGKVLFEVIQREFKGDQREFKGNSGGNICFFFLFSCFLIIALADHYFWTLQQGGIIFWLALALTKNE